MGVQMDGERGRGNGGKSWGMPSLTRIFGSRNRVFIQACGRLTRAHGGRGRGGGGGGRRGEVIQPRADAPAWLASRAVACAFEGGARRWIWTVLTAEKRQAMAFFTW
ncbi:hypothetical protein DAI22_03g320301 [Oryza sativa Japonica Group]|nr:hypothetical protein DAI22_03g320301 [Oryza sativa Japonica Group]